MDKSRSQWQPIGMLSDFSRMIDRTLNYSQKYLKAMKDVEQDPGIIDDEIIIRTFRLCNEQLDDHELFVQQLTRWKKLTLTEDQTSKLDYAEKQTFALKVSNEEILTITQFIERSNSNKKRAPNDAEIRFDIDSGDFKLKI